MIYTTINGTQYRMVLDGSVVKFIKVSTGHLAAVVPKNVKIGELKHYL